MLVAMESAGKKTLTRRAAPWAPVWATLLALAVLACPPARAQGGSTAAPDLEQVLSAIVKVEARIPADARTARGLGTERAGNGVVIDDSGLVLTIGYLILEASAVLLTDNAGRQVPADIVAYDHETGFGLVRALGALEATPLRLGDSSALVEGKPVLVAGHGGPDQAGGAYIVSRRAFAGYWEYLLERAIFTAPPHPNWGGAALIGEDGRLLGIGSLIVPDARAGADPLPGNMFVPINLLSPILGDLLSQGAADRPAKPWIGMFSAEASGHIVVTRVAPDGPAAKAGIKPGDIIRSVAGEPATDVADMYRKVWALGQAGVEVPLGISRDRLLQKFLVRSGNRNDYLKLRPSY